jgi:hypothetical protein
VHPVPCLDDPVPNDLDDDRLHGGGGYSRGAG